MGFDCTSGKTKGKCSKCKVVWYWKAGILRLKDAKCPQCGGPLTPTVHYMKRFPWKPMPE
jgi:NAD-dependent SIR2 family protein deacetylase